jgi:hypothetical protein
VAKLALVGSLSVTERRKNLGLRRDVPPPLLRGTFRRAEQSTWSGVAVWDERRSRATMPWGFAIAPGDTKLSSLASHSGWAGTSDPAACGTGGHRTHEGARARTDPAQCRVQSRADVQAAWDLSDRLEGLLPAGGDARRVCRHRRLGPPSAALVAQLGHGTQSSAGAIGARVFAGRSPMSGCRVSIIISPLFSGSSDCCYCCGDGSGVGEGSSLAQTRSSPCCKIDLIESLVAPISLPLRRTASTRAEPQLRASRKLRRQARKICLDAAWSA